MKCELCGCELEHDNGRLRDNNDNTYVTDMYKCPNTECPNNHKTIIIPRPNNN